MAQLGHISPRSQKPNYFLRKAFKESKQKSNEGCQSLWLRLVTDYREAYDKKDFEFDERDEDKIIRVFLKALRSDRIRRKLKEQEVFLRFDWTQPASFAKQAKLFEAEENSRKSEVEAKYIVNYINDDKRCRNPDPYRDRSLRFEPYSRGRGEERRQDRNRRERSDSRDRIRYRSSNRYGHEYRRDSSQSHNDRYRDSSRYHDGGNNDGHYRSSRNYNENRYGRDASPNHDFRSNRVRHFSDADPDFQGN